MMGVVVAIASSKVHGWQLLAIETKLAQSIVFPLNGIVKACYW
jgi:hypothetical protein